MPEIEVVFFAEDDGSAPALEWLDGLPATVRDRFIVRVERLAAVGSALRRPEADYLRDGIFELRVRHRHSNYRMLYFFSGCRAVLSHGLLKESGVPDQEIRRALARREAFGQDEARHTYGEG
jgi:phage-related protein